MTTYSKNEIINHLIPNSAGYQTDVHPKNTLSTSTNPLPGNATKIRLRYLNDDRKSFSWSTWFTIV